MLFYHEASMRPRVFPAEDMLSWVGGAGSASASMRPRVFPAEDTPATAAARYWTASFNEAARIPRGRLAGTRTLGVEVEQLQ